MDRCMTHAALRALHEEARAASERRRAARWRVGLQILGLALLAAAIAG